MIKLNYQEYRIEIFNDETYTKNSADNLNQYDFEYSNDDSSHIHSKHGIRILKGNGIIKSAILLSSDGTAIVAAILNNDDLAICVGSHIFSINIPSLKLNWKIKADSAACFGVYWKNNSYIVHGELEISQIDQHGKMKWQFSGKDIFTTPKGDLDFMIKDDGIFVKDWEYNQYKIDFNGNGGLLNDDQ